ncbi:MAG: hypothetical protein JZU65_24765 [Chlorobium sp.]|nr:hypothetical protein [Chlorobium sp.]
MAFFRSEEHKKNPGTHSLVLWVLIVSLVALFAWANVYRVDQTTRGTGSVISSSRVQVIQAVDGGVLKSLKVKEGDIGRCQ